MSRYEKECIGLEMMVDGKMTGKDLEKTRAPQGKTAPVSIGNHFQAFVEGMGIKTLEDFLAAAKIEKK